MSTTKIAALTLSASALIFAACTTATMAQQRGANACVAEMMAQCPGVQPGEGRIRACLRERFKDLSKPCQALILKAALGLNGRPLAPPAQAGMGIGGGPVPPPAQPALGLGGGPPSPPAPRTASSAGGEGTCANARHCRHPIVKKPARKNPELLQGRGEAKRSPGPSRHTKRPLRHSRQPRRSIGCPDAATIPIPQPDTIRRPAA